MREIVRETGLSKGAFYHYFTSKEDVFEEVVRYFYEHLVLADYQLYPNDSLKSFYSAYINRLSQNTANRPNESPETNPFVFVVEAMRRLPNLREIQQKQQSGELKFWIAAVKNAKASGEIKTKLSDTAIAKMFININDGVLLHYTLSQGNTEEMVRELRKTYDNLYSLLES